MQTKISIFLYDDRIKPTQSIFIKIKQYSVRMKNIFLIIINFSNYAYFQKDYKSAIKICLLRRL